jgi:aminoglycoside 6'-N-acetyltransferase I
MGARVRLLAPGERVGQVAAEVFDHPVDAALSAEFADDPRHFLCVAEDGGLVVGMASALVYVHPDKRPQLWINEVGVAPTHRRQGLARALVERLKTLAADLGCTEAWVLTDDDNEAARGAYRAAGGEETPGVVMVTFPLLPRDA